MRMRKLRFTKLMRACTTGQTLDPKKILALPLADRREAAYYIVGHRGPLLAEFAEGLDPKWLAAMGYLYRTASTAVPGFTFIHNGETRVR